MQNVYSRTGDNVNNDPPSRTISPHPPPSLTSLPGNATAMNVKDLQEDKEQRSSLSHNSSPRLTSILLSPSDGGASRPRTAEGRVTSLNLPRTPSRVHRHSSGGYKRRANGSLGSRADIAGETEEDGFLNFGLGSDDNIGSEDPRVLEDVQRVLRSKALRESVGQSNASSSNIEVPFPHSSTDVSKTDSIRVAQVVEAVAATATPPKPVNTLTTQGDTMPKGSLSRIAFPSSTRSPTRSMESLSSLEPTIRSPLPVLVPLSDGTAYLDWSGDNSSLGYESKDRSIIGRTLSLTKRKVKQKVHTRNFSRTSIDHRGSQGDLHSALLDSIRRTCKRETLSRAELTRDEISRRYAYLNKKYSSKDSLPNILQLVKLSSTKRHISLPWLAWSHKARPSPLNNTVWTVPVDLMDERLQNMKHSPYIMPTSSSRPVSPSHTFPSPVSSTRSSLNMLPGPEGSIHGVRKQSELSRSLSANTMVEGVLMKPRPTSPIRALSFSHAGTSLDQRTSNDFVKHGESQALRANVSPRSSIEITSDRPSISSLSKMEKESSVRRRFRMSLGGDMKSINEFGPSAKPSAPYPTRNGQHGNGSSSRLHLAVGNMFGRILKSGDEGNDLAKVRSRSSMSDNDSAREVYGATSDGRRSSKTNDETYYGPQTAMDRRGLIPQIKEARQTTDSDHSTGVQTARAGRFVKRGYTEYYRSAEEDSIESKSRGTDSVIGSTRSTQSRPLKRERRHGRIISPGNTWDREEMQDVLRKIEEEEERSKDIYKTRELLLIEANDHNRKIARLLRAVAHSIRQFDVIEQEFSKIAGDNHTPLPSEILEAVSADPATTLRHGKGWKAVEESHQRFHLQQNHLASYLTSLRDNKDFKIQSDLRDSIQKATDLWHGLKSSKDRIDIHVANVEPALQRAAKHVESVQRDFNQTQILVETDYPELSRITELEAAIIDHNEPRGWLELAAVWLPEHVLEFIGGFIRFFGVPISEKFIRPILWYFFRNRYYWKIYSTSPPPSERAWYTRLAYWAVILSLLAWYCTADAEWNT